MSPTGLPPLDRPRGPLCSRELLKEHGREERGRGRGLGLRQGLEDRGVTQRGQGLRDPAALGRRYPPHLGTEATGSISWHPAEGSENWVLCFQRWG